LSGALGSARAGTRLALLIAVSVLLAAPIVPLRLAAQPLGRRARALSLRSSLRVQQAWGRAVLAIMGVSVDRPAGAPPDGCVLVSNHLSYLDIPLLASVLPCRFVSKAEVADWPLVGVLAKLAHVLFLDRGRKADVHAVGREIAATLEQGVTVTFFPEGTSTRGAQVERFHAGLLEPAAAGGIPCVAVALHYEAPGDIAPPACTICWWGDTTFGPHAWNLMKLRRIHATVRWSDAPLSASDRKELAAGLHARVSALFVPVRQEAGESRELAVTT
jgi:1-acyl-sn-glycerol-3-phosphate acyltransferase